jgi:hypothetical protein
VDTYIVDNDETVQAVYAIQRYPGHSLDTASSLMPAIERAGQYDSDPTDPPQPA